MTAEDLDTLVLESRYGELQYLIKGPMQTNWRDGFPKQEPKIIEFQFDRFVCDIGDEIRRKELTDEDKEYIARKIERDLLDPEVRVDIWVHKPPVVNPPWPTYDDMHANAIAGMAKQIGLVQEALTYENRGRADGPRESVVKKLEEVLNGEPAGVAEDDFAAV